MFSKINVMKRLFCKIPEQYVASGYGVPLSREYYNKLLPFSKSIGSFNECYQMNNTKQTLEITKINHPANMHFAPIRSNNIRDDKIIINGELPIIFSGNFINDFNGFVLFAPIVYLHKYHIINHSSIIGPLLFNEKYPKEITDLVYNYYDYKYSDPIFCCNSGCAMCPCVYDGKNDFLKNILSRANIDYTQTYYDQYPKNNKFKGYGGFGAWLLENRQNTIESRMGYYAQLL
jgi:hypothetical protein